MSRLENSCESCFRERLYCKYVLSREGALSDSAQRMAVRLLNDSLVREFPAKVLPIRYEEYTQDVKLPDLYLEPHYSCQDRRSEWLPRKSQFSVGSRGAALVGSLSWTNDRTRERPERQTLQVSRNYALVPRFFREPIESAEKLLRFLRKIDLFIIEMILQPEG